MKVFWVYNLLYSYNKHNIIDYITQFLIIALFGAEINILHGGNYICFLEYDAFYWFGNQRVDIIVSRYAAVDEV